MSNGAMKWQILKSLDEDCPWCCIANLEVAIGTEDSGLVEYVRCPNRECGHTREGGSFRVRRTATRDLTNACGSRLATSLLARNGTRWVKATSKSPAHPILAA